MTPEQAEREDRALEALIVLALRWDDDDPMKYVTRIEFEYI